MSGIRDQEEIDELRKRLYARGPEASDIVRHELSNETVEVAREWTPRDAEDIVVEKIRNRGYRKFVLLGSILIFVLVAALSAAFIFFGGNRISGDNISFNLAGGATVGGSETYSFQVGITNQNDVGIESAVLVLKYPSGTRSISEPIKNIYEERIEVGVLGAGEVKNLPIQVGVYGKENEEKQIEATFEYKIANSDGTFYKVAEPLRFRITSSPLTLQVSSIGKVAAGQPVEIILTAKSNSSKPLKDVLVTAAYPNGFSFKQSDPKPIYNQNTWKIDELLPEQSVKIKINGTITGLTEEKFAMNFSAGVAQSDNQYIVGSVLAEARTEFAIESPFIAVDISIDSDADRSVVLEEGRSSGVEVSIKNTLDESVYDMVVEVVPSGNALKAESIETQRGYYDSNKGVVRWDVANNSNFSQVLPGDTRTLNFTILPNENKTTSSFDITINVYARRVAEQSAQEQLIGTVTAEAKYSSAANLSSQVNHMTGSVPPRVGQVTSYLVTLVAEAGGNDITNTTINTSLPTYVEWQNDYSGPGTLDYNPISKQIEWKAGDLKANTRKELVFSVSILPSVSQVGMVPVLVNRQTLRAIDRFTNTPLTADASQAETELSTEAGYQEGNGRVIQ
ncbi:MAG: hypothetical protein KBC62_02335 [Candidatus Pacebacteria bacterium]|nr:hypothetical protein [Candidatus Paceibacterota bacterium]MBP9842821.1 hypothetical protein [Candidatus Paceibacterota bacterium]